MKLATQFTALALSVAAVVQASPSLSARDPIPAYCNKVISTCAAAPDVLTNPWNTTACLLATTCFATPDGSGSPDLFLASLAKTKNAVAPKSANLPRVSQTVFNSISGDDQVINILDWIDAFSAELAKSNGPFPDARAFEGNYERVAVWASFCKRSEGVPFKNFADFFQLSSTVVSHGCEAEDA